MVFLLVCGPARARAEYATLFPDLRATVAALQAQRDALRQEIALLERQKADWQLDNPQISPGGYLVTDPAGTAGPELDGWPSCEEGEVPVHPLLWPRTREAVHRWNLWARDHPDRAAKSLATENPSALRQTREELRAALEKLDAPLAAERLPE